MVILRVATLKSGQESGHIEKIESDHVEEWSGEWLTCRVDQSGIIIVM